MIHPYSYNFNQEIYFIKICLFALGFYFLGFFGGMSHQHNINEIHKSAQIAALSGGIKWIDENMIIKTGVGQDCETSIYRRIDSLDILVAENEVATSTTVTFYNGEGQLQVYEGVNLKDFYYKYVSGVGAERLETYTLDEIIHQQPPTHLSPLNINLYYQDLSYFDVFNITVLIPCKKTNQQYVNIKPE